MNGRGSHKPPSSDGLSKPEPDGRPGHKGTVMCRAETLNTAEGHDLDVCSRCGAMKTGREGAWPRQWKTSTARPCFKGRFQRCLTAAPTGFPASPGVSVPRQRNPPLRMRLRACGQMGLRFGRFAAVIILAGTGAVPQTRRAERQMNADRTMLTDKMQQRIEPLLPGKAADPGPAAADDRLFVEAVLQRIRTGAPQRDLPPRFGKQHSVCKRFRRWVLSGVFNTLSEAFDFECLFIDGSIAQVHPKASGAKKGARPTGDRAFPGRSGQQDPVGTPRLMEGLSFGALTADRAFDAGRLLK